MNPIDVFLLFTGFAVLAQLVFPVNADLED